MGAPSVGESALLFGRDVEQRRLEAMLADGAHGKPSVLLVKGEAGVGKTTLVRDACARFPGPVLWGTCVHFSASPVPFAGVVSALDGWVSGATQDERAEVLAGLDAMRVLLPSDPSGGHASDAALVLAQIDAAVLRIAHRQPAVLVVDALQWADASTLDLLAFLVSGLRTQTLAVIATVRDEDRPDGHPVNEWMADIRRMPGVEEVHLERLGPEDTAEQVEALVERRYRGEGLAAQVYARSGGNPYLTELIVSEPTGSGSGTSVSEALRAALLLRWHALSEPAREVARLVAIGGRPVEVEVLEGVVGILGERSSAFEAVRQGIGEAVTAGVLVRPQGNRVWFRHPLIAEVLTSDAVALDSGPAHSAYAKVLAGGDAPEPGDLASHHELAGEWSEAFRWSLVAAQSAAALQGATEHLEHLQRACRLWPRLPAGSPEDHVELLLRTSRAAQCVADPEQALSLIDQALSLTDRARNPGRSCRLLALQHRMLVESRHLPWTTVTPALREAQQIAQSLPGTPEQVIVDSMLAWTELWADHERGRALADAALHTAKQTGSPDALIPALVVSAQGHPEANEAMDWLEEAYELARVSGDVIEMLDAALGMHNLHQVRGEYAAAIDLDLRRGADLILAGAPGAGRFVLTCAGVFALCLGRWAEAEAHLRPALASADGGHREAVARCAMAVLWVRLGDLARAEQELDRAAEISSTDYMGTATYPFGRVELLMAQGRPAEALAVVQAQIAVAVLGDHRDGDELLLLGARAAADLAQDGRDRGLPDAVQAASAQLASVQRAACKNASRRFVAWGKDDLVQPAREALYEAELARLGDRPDQAERWARARSACQRAGLRWEEGFAASYEARAALRDRRPRTEAAQPLRDAMAIALELGAAPLRRSVETTARASHISLEPIQHTALQAAPDGTNGALTHREQEILMHVVAGRSNLEIAKALFISDKTVSVHISNILRKTGTTSRVEAAAWANRHVDRG